MATRKKTSKSKRLSELPPELDRTAPLDSARFISAARPVLKLLAEDLLKRADASPGVTRALKARHEAERKAEHTGDGYAVWRRNFVGQVADAWVLSVVFVRTLEDRGLLPAARIAGPGAADSQRLFFELAPSLTERDYLLTVFKELSHFPAARALFDAKHNPVWKLSPSAEAARELLALFRLPSAETPAFRFGQSDTRFLGDLYQDLDEDVRERFALLQTPRFIERFILDRTLEPAIERFGLDETTLIDPACGSGHFLLGAFDRLFEHHQRTKPGLDARALARLALDAIAGADINPYAIAIARFRLTLSYLDKVSLTRLSDAPELPLHLAVADSLLHNPHGKLADDRASWRAAQGSFAELEDQSAREWLGEEFALEDESAARDVLYKRYAAVVGNPPYITVKDSVLRERYRGIYATAFRSYSLGVPFTERFFQLAKRGGGVGMITANSFMKREFGCKLVEVFLPTVNLTVIANTSGASIPGHGTPTVLLFGTAEDPQTPSVWAILGKRGEPSTPTNPEEGLVWQSIVNHHQDLGFDNEYITVSRIERRTLGSHPWSLGGGGASDLKELLESRAAKTLKDLDADIGTGAVTREDDVFLLDSEILSRWGIPPEYTRAFVVGENVRDWAMHGLGTALWPYDAATLDVRPSIEVERALWPWRTQLKARVAFGKTQLERGLPWCAYSMFFAARARKPLTITFAFVATHNHFVLDRGGKVFNRTAPIIKLPEGTTEDDHLALLGYLNSSSACFWMKQVCHNKTNASQKHSTDPARAAYEFAGTALEELPVYQPSVDIKPAVSRLLTAGEARSAWLSGTVFRSASQIALESPETLERFVAEGWENYDRATANAAYLQEELDWLFYEAVGLIESGHAGVRLDLECEAALGARPFEHAVGYVDGVSARARRVDGDGDETPLSSIPAHWAHRRSMLEREGIRTIEGREFKRMWRDTEQNVDQQTFRMGLAKTWVTRFFSDALENVAASTARVQTLRSIDAQVATSLLDTAAHYLVDERTALAQRILDDEAVPFLAASVYSEAGLDKRDEWERTWALQRKEDAGGHSAGIPLPPPYSQGSRGKTTDFRDSKYWRLRGKLDVPKERFISYPGCESDEDRQPVYGWAGWNHLQRAQALAQLYTKRKDEEAWGKERLTPMLAGLLELIPWVKQWHNEPSDEFAGLRLGDYFADFLDAQCRELGLTRDDLLAWRPTKQTAARKAIAKGAIDPPTPSTDEEPTAPKPKRARKKKAASQEAPT
jgi:hypothetical protein